MNIDTPETNACYARAGMMLAAQVDELDTTCQKLERERDEAREQRDRLAEVLQGIRDGYGGQVAAPDCCEDCEFLIRIDKALQSLTPKYL